MVENKRALTKDRTRVLRCLAFLNAACEDYLAARILLHNEGLLSAATVLASTSIEKYIKAYVALRGNICHGHLRKALINSLKNFQNDLFARLNEEFLEFLAKAYKLRYLDQLEPGFNLCIARRKALAELDFTVHEMETRIKIGMQDKLVDRRYEALLKRKKQTERLQPQLWDNNYLLHGMEKKEFIERPDVVYEIRNLTNDLSGIFEIHYWTAEVKDDGKFLLKAPPSPAPNKIILIYKPLDDQEKNE